MLSFLGLRKESKKSPSEKEADGGFVIVGETLEEQRGKIQSPNIAQPSSGYVIVQASCPYPSLPSEVKRPAPPLPLPPLRPPPHLPSLPPLPPQSSCPYPSLPSEVKRPAPPLPLPPLRPPPHLPPLPPAPEPSPSASCPYPSLASDIKRPAPPPPLPPPSSSSSVGESSSVLPDLLEDVPFSLSPHVLTVMSSLQLIPDLLLDPELSYNLSSFQYDFSLENSVLHNA